VRILLRRLDLRHIGVCRQVLFEVQGVDGADRQLTIIITIGDGRHRSLYQRRLIAQVELCAELGRYNGKTSKTATIEIKLDPTLCFPGRQQGSNLRQVIHPSGP
jgi:hypothetical protein